MYLYNYELCLIVNYLLVAYLWLPDSVLSTLSWAFPTRQHLFVALFGLANGPVAWYIVVLDGTLSFFDRSRTTSAFVHFGPPLVSYCVRHFPVEGAEKMLDSNLIVPYALTLYATWAVFQYFIVLGYYYSTIQERSLLCVYMESTFDPIRRFTRSHSINRLVYFTIHGLIAVVSVSLTPFFYNNETVHFYFLVGVAAIAVWNGSGDSLDRFQEAYQKELRDRLKIRVQEGPPADPKMIVRMREMIAAAKGGGMKADAVEDHTLVELGLDSMRVGMLGAALQDEFKVYDLELGELQNKGAEGIARLVTERAGKGGGQIVAAPASFLTSKARPAVEPAMGNTLAEVFLEQCDRLGGVPGLADDSKPGGSVLSYSRCKLGALLISEYLHAQPDLGDSGRVGVMMPAAAGSTLSIFAALICGRTPVMLNFTIGAAKLSHTIADARIKKIITSRKFVETLLSKGVDMPAGIGDMFLFVEDIMDSYTTFDLLCAKIMLGGRSAKSLLARYGNTHTGKVSLFS